ncbi:MAG: hypothetical protein HYR51_02885 [Candidatus Rokubacteria bacterium]|nr:hypothetical protein [Candidatus Rokubacteria bacterium]
MTILRLAFMAVTAVVLAFGAPVVAGAAQSCDALPRSALKTRSCNPQAECRAAISKDARGAARDRRARDCERLPISGVCHGPDRYDPQADCRTQRRNK